VNSTLMPSVGALLLEQRKCQSSTFRLCISTRAIPLVLWNSGIAKAGCLLDHRLGHNVCVFFQRKAVFAHFLGNWNVVWLFPPAVVEYYHTLLLLLAIYGSPNSFWSVGTTAAMLLLHTYMPRARVLPCNLSAYLNAML